MAVKSLTRKSKGKNRQASSLTMAQAKEAGWRADEISSKPRRPNTVCPGS